MRPSLPSLLPRTVSRVGRPPRAMPNLSSIARRNAVPVSAETKRVRGLRLDTTDAERMLWRGLRYEQLGWRFRRQHPIPPDVADFACPEAMLVVEADGGQHALPGEHELRDENLRRRGWRILRF